MQGACSQILELFDNDSGRKLDAAAIPHLLSNRSNILSYSEAGSSLSKNPLEWMIRKAAAAKLDIDDKKGDL